MRPGAGSVKTKLRNSRHAKYRKILSLDFGMPCLHARRNHHQLVVRWNCESQRFGHVVSQSLISTVHAKCGNGNRWLFFYVCTRNGQMVAIQRSNLASVYEIFSHVMRIFLRSAFTCRGALQMFSHLRRICVWFLFTSNGPLIERSL